MCLSKHKKKLEIEMIIISLFTKLMQRNKKWKGSNFYFMHAIELEHFLVKEYRRFSKDVMQKT